MISRNRDKGVLMGEANGQRIVASSTRIRRKRREVGLEAKDKKFELLQVKEKDPDDEGMTEVMRGGSMPSRTMVEAPNYGPFHVLNSGDQTISKVTNSDTYPRWFR